MVLRAISQFRSSNKGESFNMTPIIDIVFLLIIFFLVVCQFIDAENFPVAVPEGCQFADNSELPNQLTTVTVMKIDKERIEFAVGSERIAKPDYSGDAIVVRLSEAIDARLDSAAGVSRIVTLRIDKDVPFSEAQYALASVAASSATDVQLAVIKD